LEKVPVSVLKPGDVIDQNIYTEDLKLLLVKGTELTADILRRLSARGITEILTDSKMIIELGKKRAAEEAGQAGESAPPAEEPEMPQQEELKEFISDIGLKPILEPAFFRQSLEHVSKVITQVITGSSADKKALAELARELIAKVLGTNGTALMLYEMAQHDQYEYAHAIRTATLFITLNKDEIAVSAELEALVQGVLMHNVGMLRVPEEIRLKPGRLTPDEFRRIKKHPPDGVEMLSSSLPLAQAAMEMIAAHHERLDGQGYHRGLADKDIPFQALILSICDCYDALITDRPFRKALQPSNAINLLIQDDVRHFGSKVLHRLLRKVGLYPVGTVVLLNTGELGIVTKINPMFFKQPVVHLMYDRNHVRIGDPQPVNLAESRDRFIWKAIGK
jgi:HD-GYP domain-containing protein (c-di-GMP phosphodiesterase class II)